MRPARSPNSHRTLAHVSARARNLERRYDPLIVVLPDDALDAVIDFNTSGSHDLIAAPGTGKKIKVIGCTLIAADVVNVKFLDGTPTDKTGAFPLIGSTGFASLAFICASNKKLQINLSVSIQVSGVINYLIIDG